ncbi:MAG: molybdenum ABC transporter ATP-binding protein [Calditrichaeota bacterium]|nr:MAG: molybdenum ABC transporter ATP-binding protein [Calditrichota bacterium]
MNKPLIQAEFSLKLGHFALNFSAEITCGFTALFGPSGCGKTTTLKCISGLIRPAKGFINIGEKILFSKNSDIFIKPEKRKIGHVFQDSRLFPHLSVRQNLVFGYDLTPVNERRFDIGQVIDFLGLSPLLKRDPSSLSGGESQRVAIGRALLASPILLLMDEPFAAIDQPTKISLLTALKKIHQRFDMPIIYVSHDISTVLNIATEVILMNNGKVEATGSPFEVLANYFSSSMLPNNMLQNIFKVRLVEQDERARTSLVESNGVKFVLPYFEDIPEEDFFLDVPASEIILATKMPSGLSARNILPGKISQIQRIGERIFIQVDAGIPVWAEVVEKTRDNLKLKNNLKVYLVIKATAFRRIT